MERFMRDLLRAYWGFVVVVTLAGAAAFIVYAILAIFPLIGSKLFTTYLLGTPVFLCPVWSIYAC